MTSSPTQKRSIDALLNPATESTHHSSLQNEVDLELLESPQAKRRTNRKSEEFIQPKSPFQNYGSPISLTRNSPSIKTSLDSPDTHFLGFSRAPSPDPTLGASSSFLPRFDRMSISRNTNSIDIMENEVIPNQSPIQIRGMMQESIRLNQSNSSILAKLEKCYQQLLSLQDTCKTFQKKKVDLVRTNESLQRQLALLQEEGKLYV
eukprot:c12051_g1_i1.p1 GENE.c12051_g1_i1~~c12051_g1_i1.p1  ORF type:complete len:205 (+),score=85.95 c12051_g1_i1:134-748(+)